MKRRTRFLRLGLVAAILLGVGATYANTTDTASTSDFKVTSQEEVFAVDLDISDSTTNLDGQSDCNSVGTVDNQDTGADFLLIDDIGPGAGHNRWFCLKNNGTDPLTIPSVDITDTTSVELACTNDEASEDPDGAGCGTAGELEDEVQVRLVASPDAPGRNQCSDASGSGAEAKLTQLGIADGTYALTDTGGAFALSPGDAVCVNAELNYDAASTTVQEQIANQTDELTFRVAFNAEAA